MQSRAGCRPPTWYACAHAVSRTTCARISVHVELARLNGVTAYVESKAGVAGRPERTCQLAEEAALSLVWHWRGLLEGEWAGASARLFST